MIIIDFETRSLADLKKVGAVNYTRHPSTDIICMASMDTESGQAGLWYPDTALDAKTWKMLAECEQIAAHNAEFDQGIYERVAVEKYGLPPIPADAWLCTAAQARVNALPSSLDACALALGVEGKLSEGKNLIKQLSVPKPDGTFNHDPELIRQMGDYCLQDVRVTAEVYASTRKMSALEWDDYTRNAEINRLGVKVDLELVNLAIKYAEQRTDEAAGELTQITKGMVTRHTQTARAKQWVQNHLSQSHDMQPTLKRTFDKVCRAGLLDSELPGDVRKVVEIIESCNKASVAKFIRMRDMADNRDSRVRGAFIHAGASQTHRFTSQGLQLHNIARDCLSAEETGAVLAKMRRGERIPDTMQTLSKLLRPAIVPDTGCKLVVADWSSIEARVLPWLANDKSAQPLLKTFKQGKDVYIETAKAMGGVSRQVGKVATLALGFQGGVGAFQSMSANYGLHIDEVTAQSYVYMWRQANPWAVQFWKSLNQAALQAVGQQGSIFKAGRVSYYFDKRLIGGTLMAILPGEHVIQYPRARIEEVVTPFGMEYAVTCTKASIRPKAGTTGWPRASLYGGVLAENVTQAFAAALLRYQLRKTQDVVAHVHDEIVLEVPDSIADAAEKSLLESMTTAPRWAKGLPLAATSAIMSRYGK